MELDLYCSMCTNVDTPRVAIWRFDEVFSDRKNLIAIDWVTLLEKKLSFFEFECHILI